ncbi:Rap1a/Tai family immunity protein [Paraburkholderia sp. BCC1885]|uniref:Rap1a/Tai family immunity protein n=1 Tax=Paraburkholderia sp. BCC1885 TaxID=2562669 RepID=UPI0011829062|nr:Rap1a/Tai family immunity protein [Paraburkholderia sp. BCC1885]
MNKSLAALALVALCSTVQAAPASDADDGFLTGKFFRSGSEAMRAAYVIGMLDGFSYSTALGAPDAKIEKLRHCISGMNANTKQVGTIVDQYLDAHPESWGEKMQPIVLRAMRQACSAHGLALD